ncbi:ATPase, T2SS/T4P/T4SS family [Pseudodesulfovibrio pelocollis]|uniref:ATPase, T2SS/T4P/T4SS family n=1 Tax=Pseudodesulfovibrio pelocollis TaxID=3051432 RepID=UPI00255AB7E8|nr:ATPase, T2SS/T4P/T4SS family [Pseudodesulfovibrio sp. SB368]
MTENPSRLAGEAGEYNAFLERYSMNIGKHIHQQEKDDLIELCINEPGGVWIETKSRGWEYIKDASLTLEEMETFARQLAFAKYQQFHRDQKPLLFCDHPNWGCRVAIAGRGLVDSGFACSMRFPSSHIFPLDSFCKKKTCSEIEDECEVEIDVEDKNLVKMIEALLRDENIVIAGGTNSGKTSFMKALFQKYIPLHERIIVIEDTKELVLPHKNIVRMIKSKTSVDVAQITYGQIIDVCMRMRPDRLVLGELDDNNVRPFLALLNSGHGGSITSLHATGVDGVHAKIATLGASATTPYEDVLRQARHVVRNVLYIKGHPRFGFELEFKQF